MAKKNAKPWLEDVEGDEVPNIIECDADIIVVEAGPGTGRPSVWPGECNVFSIQMVLTSQVRKYWWWLSIA